MPGLEQVGEVDAGAALGLLLARDRAHDTGQDCRSDVRRRRVGLGSARRRELRGAVAPRRGPAERQVADVEDRRIRLLERQRVADVVGEAVAHLERPRRTVIAGTLGGSTEEAPLQEPHDRRVVVGAVVDEAGHRVRRRHDRRHPESGLPVVGGVVVRGSIIGQHRRRDVVEEATPLVVGEEEQAVLPAGRFGERLEHVAEEPLAGTGIGVRMIVGLPRPGIGRVEERDGGEVAGVARLEVLVDRRQQGAEARAPERQARQVAEVRPDGDAGAPQPIPDRVELEAELGDRDVVVVVPTRLGAVQVAAVRLRRGEHRRVVVVERREPASHAGVERQVVGLVVAEGVAVVAAVGPEEPAVALRVTGGPAVARVVEAAAPPGVRHRLGVEVERVDHLTTRRIEVALHRLGVDGERVAVAREPPLEVALVAAEPSEVVIEGAVLHHQHDDVFDGRLRRREVEHAARRQHVGVVLRSDPRDVATDVGRATCQHRFTQERGAPEHSRAP